MGTVESTDSSSVEEVQNGVKMKTITRKCDRAESTVPASTVTGPDDIPIEVIKTLKNEQIEVTARN